MHLPELTPARYRTRHVVCRANLGDGHHLEYEIFLPDHVTSSWPVTRTDSRPAMCENELCILWGGAPESGEAARPDIVRGEVRSINFHGYTDIHIYTKS